MLVTDYESADNLSRRMNWDRQLRKIHNFPITSPVWINLLSTMDFLFLFLLSLRSRRHYDAVINFLETIDTAWRSSDEDIVYANPQGFNRLPMDVQQYLAERLTLKQLVMLGATSRRLRALTSRVIQLTVSDLFKPYGIPYVAIRFMQAATGVIVSGSVIPRVAMGRYPARPFTPNDVDFYSPYSTFQHAVRFLEVGSDYRLTRNQSSTYGLPSLIQIGWMTAASNPTTSINIMRSRSEHAHEPVLQFHSSCVTGSLDADGIWFANPKLLCDGKAILNQQFFRLENGVAAERALAVLKKYVSRGFSFYVDYDEAHKCGVSFSCPATIRVMVDRGCFRATFPNRAFASRRTNMQPFPGPHVLSWSYGGSGCSAGIQGEFGVQTVSPLYDFYAMQWRHKAQELIATAEGPIVVES
ncbi:hypothetical protein R3P38DRAFT_3196047 [Favolaschia claudopus]|uniref:F-box domain-containing protein n=1 Tax=Favolaschia claudopus TaxID=2862362 RepID=A0AAW0B9K1_9AGAR